MFVVLRRIERWLHQHIFKVGWLSTQNYQTTTILYYTFFLPGVVLHEVVLWLIAGMVNVRADAVIKWPEEQQIGTLELKFVQVNKKAPSFRRALIAIAPLIIGIIAIWFIADRIFDITAVAATMSTGELRDIAAGFEQLTGAPNFWLWVYIVLTIANTMYPSVPKDLQGWRTVLGAGLAVSLALTVIGLGGEIFEVLSTPLGNLIYVLQLTAGMVIAIDFVMVLILGTIEWTIERVTGNSATFVRGKMEVMTRAEALAEREQKRAKAHEAAKRQRNSAADTGPTTIYAFSFPIAGSPSELSVTEPIVEVDEPEEVIIEDTGEEEVIIEESKPARRDDIASRIAISEPRSLASESAAKAPPSVPEIPDEAEQNDTSSEEPSAIRFNAPASHKATPPPDSIPEVTEEEDYSTSDEAAEQEPRNISRPAFGINRPSQANEDTDTDSSDVEEEKPVASRPSRFGITSFQASNEADDSDSTDDQDGSKDELPPTPQTRFGVTPFRATPPSDSEDVTIEKPTGKQSSLFDVKRYDRLNQVPDDDAEDPATVANEVIETTENESTPEETVNVAAKSVEQRVENDDEATNDETDSSIEVAEEETDEEAAKDKTSDVGDDETKSDTTDNDDKTTQPATSINTRFGAPKTRFGVSPFKRGGDDQANDTTEKSEDSETKPVSSTASRFGVRPPRSSSLPTIENTDSDETEKSEDNQTKPLSSTASRFGVRPSRIEPDSDTDNDEATSSDASKSRRFGSVTPFKPASQAQDTDDDDEDSEESIFRRGRASDDAVSDLFSGFRASRNTDESDEDNDEDKDELSSRFGRRGAASSRFGGGTPIRKSLEDDDEDNNPTSMRLGGVIGSRSFGISRAVPKPSERDSDDETDDETVDDDVEYVDVEDDIYYEDDEDYINYDED